MSRSRLDDPELAYRYLSGIATLDNLQTVVDYLAACRDDISERAKAARLKGSGYKWVREYEALQAAMYVCRLLLERQKALLAKDKHELFQRGYERKDQIEHVANHK